MLTADLVRATRRGDQLHVQAISGKQRQRAEELAASYLDIAQSQCGGTQHELDTAWAEVHVEPRETKLAAGLRKLIEDACEFETQAAVEPAELRSQVFLAAAAARSALEAGQRFDRTAVLAHIGAALQLGPEQIERGLYSDLKAEQRLLRAPETSAAQLLRGYDLAQLQAVLLRAVKVTAQVWCATPDGYRELFRKLKFRRLLFQVQPAESGSHRIEIDGPFSLFESVTKYGLQLALLLPALLQADRLELEAQLRWGKARSPLRFVLSQRTPLQPDAGRARLPDEVEALLEAFQGGREGWTAAPADQILNLPGIGLCVPDLRFCHRSGEVILLEVLGYWSREAVWRRVELVQRGLPQKLLFAASQRLRVSEEVLEDHPSGALYVYKGSLSARAVIERLERLRQRAAGDGPKTRLPENQPSS
jgi:predicted nuclease of restriction endonuclease-like RecB superfamily